MWSRESLKVCLRRSSYDMRLRTAAVSMIALAWWGVLYPELCFTENTCVQVIVSHGQEIVMDQTDYQEILSASGDEIVVKSRFLEWLKEKKSKK